MVQLPQRGDLEGIIAFDNEKLITVWDNKTKSFMNTMEFGITPFRNVSGDNNLIQIREVPTHLDKLTCR
jgi:hypothetical protein